MIDDNDLPPSEDLEDAKSPGSEENNTDGSSTMNENEDFVSSQDEQEDPSKDSNGLENLDNDDDKTLSEEEKQAKEWEEMAASEEGETEDDSWNDAAIDSKKTLDQLEIDSLLGDVYSPPEEKVITRGTSVLLANKTVYYERLPMLEVVFDRLVRMMSTTFRNFTSTNVEITLSKIISMKFGDYLSNIPLPAMLGVFKAEEWDNQGLIFVDSNLIYSIVDVLLGNRRGELLKIEGRPYTTIERHLIERMMTIVMVDLKNAFQPITDINFDFERLEINPDFAAIARESNAVLVAKMRLVMEDRQGDIDVLLPYATIEPVRELLLQNFMGEKFGRDAIWENHLADRLWGTDIEIQAMFLSQIGNLYDVLNWQVGTRLFLNATNSDPVELRCGNHVIGLGKIGQKSGKVSVRLDTLLQGRIQQ
jgi:flagellar motor switch protein FliM